MTTDLIRLFEKISWKYGGISAQMLEKVLIPKYFEIIEIKEDIVRFGSAYAVMIKIKLDRDFECIVRGQTGKILSKGFIQGKEYWRELGKVRIHEYNDEHAIAELFSKTGKRDDLLKTLKNVKIGDFLEIDSYGISAKLTSALSELAFSEIAKKDGFIVKRMPEDIAKHLMREDGYYNYDFELMKDKIIKKVEVKSLWGTDTDKARLIHSKSKDYITSSCKFKTQDIFAVNLYLKTGNIMDFAFAVSEYEGNHKLGLPCATSKEGKLTEYVHQNPIVDFSNEKWFKTISEVWKILLMD